MKRILAGALGGAAVAVAIFGAGPANADNEYAGQTYEKAEAQVSQYGGTAVIASRVGDYLPTAECLVTRSRAGNSLDSSGNSRGNQVYLYLNCNDVTAQAGHPGNSIASVEGKKAKALRDWGSNISSDFAKASAAGQESWCEKNTGNCKYACEQSGTCSAEVLEYLGL